MWGKKFTQLSLLFSGQWILSLVIWGLFAYGCFFKDSISTFFFYNNANLHMQLFSVLYRYLRNSIPAYLDNDSETQSFLLERDCNVLGLFLLCYHILLSVFPEPYNASCSVWSAGRDPCMCPLRWQTGRFWQSGPRPLLWYAAGASARHAFPRQGSCVAGLHAHREQQSMQTMLPTGSCFFFFLH